MVLTPITDPVEKVIADALDTAGYIYIVGTEHKALDFYLPDFDIWIECKRFHSPRIDDQLSRRPNIILIQGMEAALAFNAMLNDTRKR
jgi:hypothetical protein